MTHASVVVRIPGAAAGRTSAVRQRGHWRLAWQRLRHHRPALVAAAVLVVLAFACIVGPPLAAYQFDDVDLRARLRPPSPGHWFGTDEVGRDALVRVLYGGQASLLVGFVVALASVGLGSIIGGASGLLGGALDNVVMRVVDFTYSIPRIVLLLVLSKIAGPGLVSIILILAIFEWTDVARLTRGMILSLREQTYVEAARASGASETRLLFRHLLPNALTPLIVAATLGAGAAIRAETTLSFLGLGIQPPTPSWGNLLSNASTYFFTAPWQVFFPGAAIFLALMSFNLLGDGLRDALDPHSS